MKEPIHGGAVTVNIKDSVAFTPLPDFVSTDIFVYTVHKKVKFRPETTNAGFTPDNPHSFAPTYLMTPIADAVAERTEAIFGQFRVVLTNKE